MSLSIWTRAASRPSERLTPVSEMAGEPAGLGAVVAAFEASFMRLRASGPCLRSIRSYGKRTPKVQRHSAALALGIFALVWIMSMAGAAERTIKIVAFGDSLTAGYQLP